MRSLSYLAFIVALNFCCTPLSEAQVLSRELDREEEQRIDLSCWTQGALLWFQVTNNNSGITLTELTFHVREGEANSTHKVGLELGALTTDSSRFVYLPVSYPKSRQTRRLSCNVVSGKTYRYRLFPLHVGVAEIAHDQKTNAPELSI